MSATLFQQPPTNTSIMVDSTDFQRLEVKVDKITDTLSKLVIVEERQTNQGVRIGEIEKRLTGLEATSNATDRELSRWVNRGIGIWLTVGVVFTLTMAYLNLKP